MKRKAHHLHRGGRHNKEEDGSDADSDADSDGGGKECGLRKKRIHLSAPVIRAVPMTYVRDAFFWIRRVRVGDRNWRICQFPMDHPCLAPHPEKGIMTIRLCDIPDVYWSYTRDASLSCPEPDCASAFVCSGKEIRLPQGFLGIPMCMCCEMRRVTRLYDRFNQAECSVSCVDSHSLDHPSSAASSLNEISDVLYNRFCFVTDEVCEFSSGVCLHFMLNGRRRGVVGMFPRYVRAWFSRSETGMRPGSRYLYRIAQYPICGMLEEYYQLPEAICIYSADTLNRHQNTGALPDDLPCCLWQMSEDATHPCEQDFTSLVLNPDARRDDAGVVEWTTLQYYISIFVHLSQLRDEETRLSFCRIPSLFYFGREIANPYSICDQVVRVRRSVICMEKKHFTFSEIISLPHDTTSYLPSSIPSIPSLLSYSPVDGEPSSCSKYLLHVPNLSDGWIEEVCELLSNIAEPLASVLRRMSALEPSHPVLRIAYAMIKESDPLHRFQLQLAYMKCIRIKAKKIYYLPMHEISSIDFSCLLTHPFGWSDMIPTDIHDKACTTGKAIRLIIKKILWKLLSGTTLCNWLRSHALKSPAIVEFFRRLLLCTMYNAYGTPTSSTMSERSLPSSCIGTSMRDVPLLQSMQMMVFLSYDSNLLRFMRLANMPEIIILEYALNTDRSEIVGVACEGDICDAANRFREAVVRRGYQTLLKKKSFSRFKMKIPDLAETAQDSHGTPITVEGATGTVSGMDMGSGAGRFEEKMQELPLDGDQPHVLLDQKLVVDDWNVNVRTFFKRQTFIAAWRLFREMIVSRFALSMILNVQWTMPMPSYSPSILWDTSHLPPSQWQVALNLPEKHMATFYKILHSKLPVSVAIKDGKVPAPLQLAISLPDTFIVDIITLLVYHLIRSSYCLGRSHPRVQWVLSHVSSSHGPSPPVVHHTERCCAYRHQFNIQMACSYTQIPAFHYPGSKQKCVVNKSRLLYKAGRVGSFLPFDAFAHSCACALHCSGRTTDELISVAEKEERLLQKTGADAVESLILLQETEADVRESNASRVSGMLDHMGSFIRNYADILLGTPDSHIARKYRRLLFPECRVLPFPLSPTLTYSTSSTGSIAVQNIPSVRMKDYSSLEKNVTNKHEAFMSICGCVHDQVWSLFRKYKDTVMKDWENSYFFRMTEVVRHDLSEYCIQTAGTTDLYTACIGCGLVIQTQLQELAVCQECDKLTQ